MQLSIRSNIIGFLTACHCYRTDTNEAPLPVVASVELAVLDASNERVPLGRSEVVSRAAAILGVAQPPASVGSHCHLDAVARIPALAALAPRRHWEVRPSHVCSSECWASSAISCAERLAGSALARMRSHASL